MLGMRVKLYSKGSGRWEKSGGEAAKFGLTTTELLEVIRRLEEADRMDMLKLLHFHIGSQLTDIKRIKNAMKEAARVYAKADESGYGNIVLTMIQARVFDDPTSPYHDAVESEKALLKAVRNNDVPSIRPMAQRVSSSLAQTAPAVAAVPVRPPASSVEVVAPKTDPEMTGELQAIEDLLTGNDSERRQGLDRLHQLLRRLRAASR